MKRKRLNDIVLDPMCGSGTTCKMAVMLDRQFIGIDVSEEYCELSGRRVAAELAQPTLFNIDMLQEKGGDKQVNTTVQLEIEL